MGLTFEPVLSRYADVAKTVLGLAVGSITLLAGYVTYVWQSKPVLLEDQRLGQGDDCGRRGIKGLPIRQRKEQRIQPSL